MATVVFSRGLLPLTGGEERVEVDAGPIRAVIRQVVERFPKLASALDANLAVSIDGEIIQEPLLEEVAPESEVHFLPPLSGGSERARGVSARRR